MLRSVPWWRNRRRWSGSQYSCEWRRDVPGGGCRPPEHRRCLVTRELNREATTLWSDNSRTVQTSSGRSLKYLLNFFCLVLSLGWACPAVSESESSSAPAVSLTSLLLLRPPVTVLRLSAVCLSSLASSSEAAWEAERETDITDMAAVSQLSPGQRRERGRGRYQHFISCLFSFCLKSSRCQAIVDQHWLLSPAGREKTRSLYNDIWTLSHSQNCW